MERTVPKPRVPSSLDGDARWSLVQRILQSDQFNKSPRLSSFLLYVCERTFAGDAESINEQDIGQNVFDRRDGYDPGSDNVVRVNARRLRARLDEYYSTEGRHEEIRLSIPIGGYLPNFQTDSSVLDETPEKDIELPSSTPMHRAEEITPAVVPRSRVLARQWLRYAVFAIVLFSALVWWYRYRPREIAALSPSNALWHVLLTQGPPTIFIPGDTGLVVLENHTHRRVTLSDYMTGDYLEHIQCSAPCSPAFEKDVAERRYTSIVDATLGAQLARLSVTTHPFEIRYARDVRMDELKNNNVILSGGEVENPWVTMYQDYMNFYLKPTNNPDIYEVINRSPEKGEAASYNDGTEPSATVSYGVISYVPNIAGTGMALLLQGTEQAGTEAAMEFVLNPKKLDALLAPHMNGRNKVPSFEVLIKTDNLNDSSPSSHIVAARFH